MRKQALDYSDSGLWTDLYGNELEQNIHESKLASNNGCG